MEDRAKNQSTHHLLKFIVISLVGVFLFMWPISIDGATPNIPLGHLITWLGGIFSNITLGGYSFDFLLTFAVITVSAVLTLVAMIAKPGFIMNNPLLKSLFATHPVYAISRLIAFAIIFIMLTDIGLTGETMTFNLLLLGRGNGTMLDFIINPNTAGVILGLTASLTTLFLVLAPAMPLITDFGLMEFLGVLIKKVVRFLFTLPGRSSIDLMASWFGSSAVGVMITSDQQDRGFYTGREAAVIATNFSFVSLPFTFTVANFIGLAEYFWLFYLIMCITCLILALILPRIWPLRNLQDDYVADVGKQIEEEVPAGTSLAKHAVTLATERAGQTTLKQVLVTGGKNYLNIYMDLIPLIMAWGTLATVLAETGLFDMISAPMGAYLNLLGIEGAFEYASTTLIGFVDMFLPALFLAFAPLQTRFILGILSIVQIIYLAETGALILKSKIPLNFGKLLAVFMLRTLIGLPIIVLLTRLLFNY